MTPARINHPGERRWETNLLATVTLMLTAFGLVNCYSAATYLDKWAREASQQATAAAVGAVLFLVAAYLDYTVWKKFAKPLFYATVAGLVPLALCAIIWHDRPGPAIVGQFVPYLNGARRWLRFGVQIQVSEIARFTTVVFLAAMVADMGPKIRSLKDGFLPAIGIIIGLSLLVFVEPSLSMAIVLACIGGGILFAAGARITHFLPLVGAGALGLWVVIRYESFRLARFTEFLTPALDCNPDDQACNSLIGVGSGGFFGVGFGQGTQKLGHLSYAYSDFLLSAIAEEWGLVGMAFVILLFSVFCWLGFRIAKSAREPFGMYLATGLTIAVGVTALLHAAVVLRMMPPTGLTLPFMSSGRASLVLYLFSAGVLVSIGRARGRPAGRA